MQYNKGTWMKTVQSKYLHYFHTGRKESLCNLSKNPTIVGGDFPYCSICKKFYRISQHLIDNQTFGFKDRVGEMIK